MDHGRMISRAHQAGAQVHDAAGIARSDPVEPTALNFGELRGTNSCREVRVLQVVHACAATASIRRRQRFDLESRHGTEHVERFLPDTLAVVQVARGVVTHPPLEDWYVPGGHKRLADPAQFGGKDLGDVADPFGKGFGTLPPLRFVREPSRVVPEPGPATCRVRDDPVAIRAFESLDILPGLLPGLLEEPSVGVQSSTANLVGSLDLTMVDRGQCAPRRGVDVREETIHDAAGQKSVCGNIAPRRLTVVSRCRHRRYGWSVPENGPRRREQAEGLSGLAGKKPAQRTGDAHGSKEPGRGIREFSDARVRKSPQEPSFPASCHRASRYPGPGPLQEVSVWNPCRADGLARPASEATAEVDRECPTWIYPPIHFRPHQIQASPRRVVFLPEDIPGGANRDAETAVNACGEQLVRDAQVRYEFDQAGFDDRVLRHGYSAGGGGAGSEDE